MSEPINLDMGLYQVLNSAIGFFDKADTEINISHSQPWLPLGHYIVMIVDGTYLLKRCYE